MGILNQYSLLVSLIIGGIMLAYGLWRWQRLSRLIRFVLFSGYVFVAIGIVVAVRYPDTSVSSIAELDSTLANGRPTFVMLYSNY